MKAIKKIKFLANVTFFSFLFPTLLFAETPLPMGWYIEANAGASKISDVSYGARTNINTTGIAWSFNGGYKFIPYFAAEMGYTSYANANITFNGSNVGRDQVKSYDIASKAIVPVQDTGVEVFAKLGVARAKSQVKVTNSALLAANGITLNTGSHTSTDFYFGLGGDYSFLSNMAANIQWNRVAGKTRTGNLDLFSVGLTYLFD